ncbi:diguanylate cyclase domain-containing protein [Pseudomonas sp. GV071]|uniref:diguanylate cyclase domain-containing protein n=1 Tax=Pseudomonas sp. GV071 TaxID=2135754 RepID=UPI000D347835|nr:diguanylate cyclase [Pseudomonas sp. GV071]
MRSEHERLLVRALEGAGNAVLITDRSGITVWANQAMSRQSGYSLAELIGSSPRILSSGQQSPEVYRQMWQTILAGKAWQGVLAERNKAGELYTVNQVISPLLSSEGAITHFLAIQHTSCDIGAEREHMHRLAFCDVLTNLPNRASLLDLLQQEIVDASTAKQVFTLLFLDLDRFKQVNDTYGHLVGDKLLVSVAQRVLGTIRRTDVLARLGGDEFVALIPQLTGEQVGRLVEKITRAISHPFEIDGHALHVGVSIGVSQFPADGCTVEQLLDVADKAMYAAKQRRQP